MNTVLLLVALGPMWQIDDWHLTLCTTLVVTGACKQVDGVQLPLSTSPNTSSLPTSRHVQSLPRRFPEQLPQRARPTGAAALVTVP